MSTRAFQQLTSTKEQCLNTHNDKCNHHHNRLCFNCHFPGEPWLVDSPPNSIKAQTHNDICNSENAQRDLIGVVHQQFHVVGCRFKCANATADNCLLKLTAWWQFNFTDQLQDAMLRLLIHSQSWHLLTYTSTYTAWNLFMLSCIL